MHAEQNAHPAEYQMQEHSLQDKASIEQMATEMSQHLLVLWE